MKLANLAWLLRNMDTPLERLYTGYYRESGTLQIWNRGKEIPVTEEISRMVERIISEKKSVPVTDESGDLKIFKRQDESGVSRTYVWIDDMNNPLEKGRYRFIALPLESETLGVLLENYYQHRTLTEGFKGFFCQLNNYGEIVKINGQGLKILDYEREDLLGQPLQRILSSPDSFSALEKLISTTDKTHSLEICLRKKGGEKFIGIASVALVKDERDDTIYSTMIITDITYQVDELNDSIRTTMELIDSNVYLKKTQTTLLRTEKMAAVGELGAGLAHEINNPLSYLMNNMTLYTEYTSQIIRFLRQLTMTTPLDERTIREEYRRLDLDFISGEMNAMSAEMREGLDHIQKIVHSLKSFSGNERAKGWNYEDINMAIGEMLIISRNRYKYDTEVKTELADIPRILCNLSELNQALLAIFNNSIQAVRERDSGDAGQITIRTGLNGEEDNLLIHFENNGNPLDEELQSRIFEPFYSNWKTVQGSGMGLTVAQDIILGLHKGDIRISRAGNKTVFTIIIPIMEDLTEGA